MNEKMKGFLSGNQLKLIALAAMTCDHAGKHIFTHIGFLQIFGRIAFPIFAYMIAEGCRYTKNRKKYLGTMAVIAIACQLVYFIVTRSLYQCVLVTFTLSISLVYAFDNVMKRQDIKNIVVAVLAMAGVFALVQLLPVKLKGTDFDIDYGIWGVLLPVFVYMAKDKLDKIIVTAMVLVFLSGMYGGIQWNCLWAIPLLWLYNGEKGMFDMKNLFYVYYPLHMAAIYGISLVVS